MAGTLIWGVGGTCEMKDLDEGGVVVRLVLPLLDASEPA